MLEVMEDERLLPPLTLTMAQAQEFIARFKRVL